MGFAPVVVFRVARLNHAAQLSTAVDPQCDGLLIKRRPAGLSGDFVISAAVGYDDPVPRLMLRIEACWPTP
jgi:hypothetical protein